MKKVFVFLSALFLYSIIFISCENFLNGENLKKELDDRIELANATEFSIEFKLPGNNIGSISPNGIQKLKKGQTIDVEISLKENITLSSINVYSKTRTSYILNNSAISFTEVSKTSQFGQNVYKYKATILNDSYELLVIPTLVNPQDTTPPEVQDNNQFPFIIKRTKDLDFKETGNVSKHTDSFYINFTAIEQENEISKDCTLNFYDSSTFENCYGSQSVNAEIIDQGNGYYNITISSDLKDAYAIQEDTNFYLEVEISDGFSSARKQISSEQFTKYTQSKSSLAVYNRPVSTVSNKCTTTDIEAYNPIDSLTLKILEIDEFFPDDYDIQWGYTQNYEELSNIPLTKITNYSKNDEISLSSISIDDKTKNTYIKIVSSALFNNKEENIFIIPATPNTQFTRVYPGTGNGIWMDVIIKKTSIPGSDTEAKAYYFIHDGEGSYNNPDKFYFNSFWTDYGSYIFNTKNNQTEIQPFYYLQSSYDYKINDTSNYSIYGSITDKKLANESNDSQITPLTAMTESKFSITPGPKNSGYHLIKLDYTEELINQFDSFLIEICRSDVYVEVRSVETVGKDYIIAKIPTQCFYSNTQKTQRVEEKIRITGIKDGAAYPTEYTISNTNQYITDNISPTLNITSSTIFLDPFQSYMAINKPDDIGSGLNISGMVNQYYNVDYKITGITVGHNEVKSINVPSDKSPTIPIAHLRNGQYDISITVYDKAGNSTTKTITYNKSRLDVPFRSLEFTNGTTTNTVQVIKDYSKLNDAGLYIYKMVYKMATGDFTWTLLDTNNLEWTNNSTKTTSKTDNIKLTNENSVTQVPAFLKGFYGSYNPIMTHYPLNQKPTLKEYMILSENIAVYTDKPIFVHTLCSEYDWGENYKDWEFHSEQNIQYDVSYTDPGIKEFNMIFESGNHLTSPYFYNIPWDNIEKFPYAVVLIYYADNTAKLVRIK